MIQAHDGELITAEIHIEPRRDHGQLVSDVERDLLKIAVVNRYAPAPPAVGFIRGFGFKRGAIASSVAHDSHNVVAVGDERCGSMCGRERRDANRRAGWPRRRSRRWKSLPLEVAGLMGRDGDRDRLRLRQARTRWLAKLGTRRSRAPFMTLAFMALLVISVV